MLARIRRPLLYSLVCLLPSSLLAEPASEADLPLEELRTFVEVMERIKNAYVEPIDDKTLLENAIKGMLEHLDPHSAWLDSKSFTELQENTSGEFGGLGLEIGTEEGGLQVIAPIDDSPAAAAGIEAGDLIIRIDGQPTKGMSLMDAVEHLRGEPGTPVVLNISRDHQRSFEVKLKRAIIKTRSVREQLLEPDYGLLRISQFQTSTGKETGKALRQLEKTNNRPLKGVVLDLRNNPGGVLQAATEVADHFLSQGRIVYTKGRLENSKVEFDAKPRTSIGQIPMVVLINGGSASASEIVAGALQDHQRAVIMGTTSFGKGSVQSVLPLGEDKGLKLTTARYYTPAGRSIQALGIEPDIVVERSKTTTKSPEGHFKEADLAGHLEGDKKQKKDNQPQSELLDSDNQLSQALSLLKGLNVLGGK